jgi:uncharacterized membrane protein YidH (DUF202 family)
MGNASLGSVVTQIVLYATSPLYSERRALVKAATIAGVVLIILGIVGFTMGGFSFTREKKDVDMGPIQIQHKQHKTVPISPAISLVAVVGGLVLMVAGARSK